MAFKDFFDTFETPSEIRARREAASAKLAADRRANLETAEQAAGEVVGTAIGGFFEEAGRQIFGDPELESPMTLRRVPLRTRS